MAGNNAAVHFLVATQEDIAPMASYYTAVSTARLEDVYAAAVTKLFRLDGGERPPSPVDRQTRFVGSQMSVQSEGLRAFAEHLAQGVTDTQPHDIAAAHNAYAMYCLWLLMSATGHRPVLDPFESRDLFDLRDGWFIAADKQVRGPDEARLIPLPSLAVEVLRLYLHTFAHWPLPLMTLRHHSLRASAPPSPNGGNEHFRYSSCSTTTCRRSASRVKL